MHYLMAPLEEHYDSGFGAVADAFYRAAKALEKENAGQRFAWNHLPQIADGIRLLGVAVRRFEP